MKRTYAASLIALAVGAALILFAASRDWVVATQDRPAPLPSIVKVASGGTLQPAIPAVGLVLLTAILMVVVTKRWGRTVVGALAGVACVLVVILSVPLLGDPSASIRTQVLDTGRTAPSAEVAVAGWAPWVVVLGALIALGGAAMVVVFGSSWRGLSSRYERPDQQKTAEQAAADRERSDRADWNSMDDGVDPTL